MSLPHDPASIAQSAASEDDEATRIPLKIEDWLTVVVMVCLHTIIRRALAPVRELTEFAAGIPLRMGDEVIQPKDAFADIPASKPNKQMIEIARKIIEAVLAQ